MAIQINYYRKRHLHFSLQNREDGRALIYCLSLEIIFHSTGKKIIVRAQKDSVAMTKQIKVNLKPIAK